MLARLIWCYEPFVTLFEITMQQVQLMITQNTLGPSTLYIHFDQFDNSRAIRPTIYQVAQENQAAALRMNAFFIVAQVFN